MDNFLAAVDTRQGVKIIIDSEPVFVPRCRLLAHLQLSEIEIKIKNSLQPVLISALIIEYLAVADLSDEQIKRASTYELLEAFFALRQLNAWQWLLPWLANSETGPAQPEFYDYSGVSEYHEREDRRALSEISYKYDQVTKTSQFIPAPAYSWMIDDSPPEPVRIPVRMLPVGNVIKMEDDE
jgi:hypothetical protein